MTLLIVPSFNLSLLLSCLRIPRLGECEPGVYCAHHVDDNNGPTLQF